MLVFKKKPVHVGDSRLMIADMKHVVGSILLP